MNGKRNPWEGVALISFIRETAMLAAIAERCPDASISPEERARNSFGTDFCFWYDPTCTDVVPSGNVDVFPDITNGQTRARQFLMPRMPVLSPPLSAPATAPPPRALDEGEELASALAGAGPLEAPDEMLTVAEGMQPTAALFHFSPPAGCVVPAPGFPTLHSLHITPERASVALDVFGTKSRKLSVVVAPRGLSSAAPDDDDDGGAPAGSLGSLTLEERSTQLLRLQRAAGLNRAHVALFSTAYAPGTTLYAGGGAAAAPASGWSPPVAGVGLDVLSQWIAAARLTGADAACSARSLAGMLGRVAFVEWPHLREARIVALSDATEVASWEPDAAAPSGGRVTFKRHSADDQVQWIQQAEALRGALLSGGRGLKPCGIRVTGALPVLLNAVKVRRGGADATRQPPG